MPICHSISRQEKCVRVIASNPLNFQILIAELSQVFADPDFDPRDPILLDLRQTDYEPSMIEVFSIGEILNGFRRKCLGGVTLVVNERILHLARLIGIIAGPSVNLQVVTNLPHIQPIQPPLQKIPLALPKT